MLLTGQADPEEDPRDAAPGRRQARLEKQENAQARRCSMMLGAVRSGHNNWERWLCAERMRLCLTPTLQPVYQKCFHVLAHACVPEASVVR